MDTAIVKKIRDEAIKNNSPLIVECDNDQIFYDNVQDQFPIVWDDSTESFTTIGVNNDYYNQSDRPFKKVTTDYSMIQYMVVVSKLTDVLDYYNANKSKLSEDKQKYFSGLIAKYGNNNVPKTRFNTNTDNSRHI